MNIETTSQKFEKPKHQVYLESQSENREIVTKTTEYATIIFGAVAASSFIASYFFTASLLTPIALGALGLAVVALFGRIFVPALLRSWEVANIKEFVKDWNPDILLENKAPDPDISLATYLADMTGDLVPMIRGCNKAKNEEKDCLPAVKFLIECSPLRWKTIATQPFIQRRLQGSLADATIVGNILFMMQQNVSLTSKALTSEDRREIIAFAESLN